MENRKTCGCSLLSALSPRFIGSLAYAVIPQGTTEWDEVRKTIINDIFAPGVAFAVLSVVFYLLGEDLTRFATSDDTSWFGENLALLISLFAWQGVARAFLHGVHARRSVGGHVAEITAPRLVVVSCNPAPYPCAQRRPAGLAGRPGAGWFRW